MKIPRDMLTHEQLSMVRAGFSHGQATLYDLAAVTKRDEGCEDRRIA